MGAFYGVAAALGLLVCALDASFRIYMRNTKAQMVARDVARVYSLYVALVAVLHLIVWLAMKVFRAN